MLFKDTALVTTVLLFGSLLQALKPPPRITIAEWAERHRRVSSEEAAAPGPWHNDVVPYMVEVMNAISDPVVRVVVLMTGAQLAKTNVLTNVIGYHMHLDPCPIMMVQPTIALGESWSGKRLTSMLRDTPCLHGLVPDEKTRTPGNTMLEKIFPGGYLTIAGANSAPSLKGRPIRVVLFDEVDEAPENLAGQGDPVELAAVRMTGFPNRKLVLASTPTIKGKSRIETAYSDSTCERWSHCCPGCGEWSAFSWRRLQLGSLEMACPHCGLLSTKKQWLAGGGKWIAENPEHNVRGFHVTAMDAPTLTWAELADEWMKASRRAKAGDNSARITFINTRLAETWEEPGEVVDSHILEKRREVYGAELPDGVCVLTMGVDVQDTRLAYEVVGWGAGFESWGIEYGELWGDPRQGNVWNRLDDVLALSWAYGNGSRLRISRAAVDTGGHMTTQVYTYCKARESRGVYAVKGQAGDRIPMTRPGKSGKSGISTRLFMIGVDGIKADIQSFLKVPDAGEGYCHFPAGDSGEPVSGYDAVYFTMLTSEKRVIRNDKNGFKKYVWEKPSGARNESWDCRVYARAALRIMSNRDDKMLERLSLSEPWANAANSAKPRGKATAAKAASKRASHTRRASDSNEQGLAQGVQL